MSQDVGPVNLKLISNATGWNHGIKQAQDGLTGLSKALAGFDAKAAAMQNFQNVFSKFPRDAN